MKADINFRDVAQECRFRTLENRYSEFRGIWESVSGDIASAVNTGYPRSISTIEHEMPRVDKNTILTFIHDLLTYNGFQVDVSFNEGALYIAW